MYFAPIFKPRIMSPLNRGSCVFVRFPGVPPPGYHISPLAGAQISAGIRPLGIPTNDFGEFFEVPKLDNNEKIKLDPTLTLCQNNGQKICATRI